MSEQYPLLCEDSDEDKFAPRFQRRRFSGLRGRASLQARGAAAIMQRWPEYWTSVLTYWWIGFGMIALTTFVVYNTLFNFGMVETIHARSNKYAIYKPATYNSEPPMPEVFMHVFINNVDDDYHKYMSHIELFANKYKKLMYNLIVLTNFTNSDTTNDVMQDEKNNNIAMNTLWSSNINYDNTEAIKTNIKVKHYSVSEYLDDSPMKKNWRDVSQNLIPFLVRAVSVWEKGGIAIDPLLLTPKCPHAVYMEKIVTIMKHFKLVDNQPPGQTQETTTRKSKTNLFPKVNNIRDIIDGLENKKSVEPFDIEVLRADESVMKTELITFKAHDTTPETGEKSNLKPVLSKHSGTENPNEQQNSSITSDNADKSQTKLLPLFLKYLFRNKNNNLNETKHRIEKRRATAEASNNEDIKYDKKQDLYIRSSWNLKSTDNNYKPMIVSAKGINETQSTNRKQKDNKDDKLLELTVDLKGYIIATATPCHAFIGNIFLDAVYHPEEETLTDFIIKELSIFCKGLLTSCMGIDVVLV